MRFGQTGTLHESLSRSPTLHAGIDRVGLGCHSRDHLLYFMMVPAGAVNPAPDGNEAADRKLVLVVRAALHSISGIQSRLHAVSGVFMQSIALNSDARPRICCC